MSAPKDGGPAFPVGGAEWNDDTHEYELAPSEGGMTLRDYFAAKALAGLCACAAVKLPTMADYARHAYEQADAMLKERDKP